MLKRMIEVALSFNQVPGKPAREKKAKQEVENKTKKISPFKWTETQQTGSNDTPIGRFNQSDYVYTFLENHGYQYDHDATDGWEHFTRPGKVEGTSCVVKQKDGVLILHNFSSSDELLEQGRTYTGFQLYMLDTKLSHKEAVKAICKMGYAVPNKTDTALETLSKIAEINRDDKGHVIDELNTYVNCLRYLPAFSGLFFNELKQRLEFAEEFMGYKGVLEDATFSLIRLYFETDLGLKPSDIELRHALNIISVERRRNPFIERIETFKWDGVERLKTFLHKAFRLPQNKLTEEVLLKLLVAVIARNKRNEPIEVCWMPIFVGNQKVGKTSFLKNWCKWIHPSESFEWYCGSMDMISFCDPAKRKELSEGAVIATIDDMKNAKKADMENFKSSMSQPRSMTRLAYGHYATELVQRFVLTGTGNLDEFLSDPTGNRRFIVLKIPLKNNECIMYKQGLFNKYIAEQLAAEALDWYNKNYHSPQDLELSDEAQAIADECAEDAFRQLPWENKVQEYVDTFRRGPYNGYLIKVDEGNQTVSMEEAIPENFFIPDQVYKFIAGGEDKCLVNMKPADRDQIVNCLRRIDRVERCRYKNKRGYKVIPEYKEYSFTDYKTPREKEGLQQLIDAWRNKDVNKSSLFINRFNGWGAYHSFYPQQSEESDQQ